MEAGRSSAGGSAEHTRTVRSGPLVLPGAGQTEDAGAQGGRLGKRVARHTHTLMREEAGVRYEATLAEAMYLLRVTRHARLPVFAGGWLVGLLSGPRARAVTVAGSLDPRQIRVHEIMRPNLVYRLDDQTIEAAITRMRESTRGEFALLNHDEDLIRGLACDR